MLKNSFGKNNSMSSLKGISPFAPKLFKSTVFTVCHTSVMKISLLWKYLWEHVVQAINILLCEDFLSSDIILLPDCELVLLWEIRKLITLESANFKLDPELNPLNDHPLVPCRTIKNFLSFFISHRDLTSLKKMKTPKWIEKKSIKMGEKKKEEKMGMSTITQQSNHQRKERKTSQNQSLWLKSLPLRRQRFVSLLITMYTLLLQNQSLLLILNWTCYPEWIGSDMIACV